jgi:hypothetical protein
MLTFKEDEMSTYRIKYASLLGDEVANLTFEKDVYTVN